MSESHKGEKCNFWKGGITPEIRKIRNSLELKQWRKEVFERDNYICVNCDKRGGYLHAHHINSFARYPEQRSDINNGTTLCRNCHSNIHYKETDCE